MCESNVNSAKHQILSSVKQDFTRVEHLNFGSQSNKATRNEEVQGIKSSDALFVWRIDLIINQVTSRASFNM